jgi:hypothetical protein
MKRLKKIPTFKDEDAEREFWSTADSTEYIDWSKARELVLPNFRSTTEKIKEERGGASDSGGSSSRRRAR